MANRVSELRASKGWSQAHLADLLSITRQTVIKLEAGKTDPGLALAMRLAWLFELPMEAVFPFDIDERMAFTKEPWEYRETTATAFNEERILQEVGLEGWEMTGFGPLVLQFRRPLKASLRGVWEYQRTEGFLTEKKRGASEQAGWLYLGSWVGMFHYFKRQKR